MCFPEQIRSSLAPSESMGLGLLTSTIQTLEWRLLSYLCADSLWLFKMPQRVFLGFAVWRHLQIIMHQTKYLIYNSHEDTEATGYTTHR